jgi:hypothetical protein
MKITLRKRALSPVRLVLQNSPIRSFVLFFVDVSLQSGNVISCNYLIHIRNGHSDPADLIGGKTPNRAFWNAQIHATCANTNHL